MTLLSPGPDDCVGGDFALAGEGSSFGFVAGFAFGSWRFDADDAANLADPCDHFPDGANFAIQLFDPYGNRKKVFSLDAVLRAQVVQQGFKSMQGLRDGLEL